jgi:GntR family galactonate operon transcriptional repressor
MANNGYTGRGLLGQVVNTLGARIVSGELVPGRPIDLGQLETELDISRTVLREALKVLTAKGLVDARQSRGTYVRPQAEWQLLDVDVLRWRLSGQSTGTLLRQLVELRSIVESAGARLAALRRDKDDVAALTEALDALANVAPASSLAADAYLSFNRRLLAISRNELLLSLAAVLELAPAKQAALVHSGNALHDPLTAHRAIVEAISNGDLDVAERAMRTLLDHAVQDVEPGRQAEVGT